MKAFVERPKTDIAAAPTNIIAMTRFLCDALAYTFPQNIPPNTAAAVPRDVTVPTCVPENPMELRYCPISGHKTPSGQYIKK